MVLFWVPVLTVQPSLAPGDTGRDLYAFWRTLQGDWPCRDYWWQYGPLMPLYYAFWFWVGGVNLVSVRVGLALIYLLCSLFTYRALRLLASGGVAFLASLAFLSYEMTWTFNHIGAIPFLLSAVLSLWKFLITRKVSWLYAGLASLFAVSLVKVSAGIASFVAFSATLFLDQAYAILKKTRPVLAWRHFLALPVIFGVAVFSVYALLYWNLSLETIHQCLTAKPEYHSFSGASPWTNFKHLILRFVIWEPSRLLGVGAFLAVALFAGSGLLKRGASSSEKRVWTVAASSLFLFGLVNSSEYFLKEGLIYRFDFWIFPVFVLFMGLGAEWSRSIFPRGTRGALGIFLFLALLVVPVKNLKEALAFKVTERYLDLPTGKVYLGGPPSYPEVLNQGTRFILEETSPDQEILALPYDALYGYLSGRRQAVRQLLFMEHMHISERQEEGIIQQLEEKQVPLVVMSNRIDSTEGGAGRFGETHCRLLAKHLSDHYEEVKTFGPWGEDPSQVHAIRILRRKS